MKSIYIDCEWFIGGDCFIIGYCYSVGGCKQLVGKSTKKQVKSIFKNVDQVFFYGPDIGVLEREFNLNLRDNFRCFNLLKIFRQVLPPQRSYKLANLEKKHGVVRSRVEYKKNIFDIFKDWKSPGKRKRILEYNQEDVINLRELKRIIFKKYKVRLKNSDRLK